MIRSLIQSSMGARFLVIGVIVAGIVILGAPLRNMPVDVLPEFSPPIVEVQTEALGLSAEEVEALITTPLEADLLSGVAWLETISSESVTGLSSIILQFEPGTDVIRARQMVQERLTQAHALPNVSTPPLMLQPLSSTNRVMMVGLGSEELSSIEMSVIARWTIKPRLMGVPGVANVAIWGQRERQLQVQVDPADLAEQGVTLQQVISTSGNALWVSPLSFLNASTPGTGGWIDTPNQRLGVRHLLPITNAEELGRVTLEGAEDLRLSDVAEVVEDHQPLIGDALVNGEPGLVLVIEKFPGENSVAVTAAIEEALATLAPGLGGIEINTELFRPATFIELAAANLRTALLISAILLIVVLLATFIDWRGALIGVVAIPLSLLASLMVLNLRGATLNMLVLTGLIVALGVLIANVVGQVDAILRNIREARAAGGERSAAQLIVDATLASNRPAIYTLLIMLVAVAPVIVILGLPGTLYATLALSYALAVVASLVVALVVTPTLAVLLLARQPREADGSDLRSVGNASPLAAGIGSGYGPNLISRPIVASVLAGILLIAAIVVLPQLGKGGPLPTFKETSLLVRWSGEPGTSRIAMVETAGQLSADLMEIAGVSNVTVNVGRAVTSDQVVDIDSGELWIRFDSEADYGATVEAVEAVVDGYPALAGGTTTYLNDLVDTSLQSRGEGLIVRVYGNEYDILADKAEEIRQLIAGVAGVDQAQVIAPIEMSRLEIEVDLGAAEEYGLKPGDVRRTAATLLSGIQVGSLFEDQKVFDVVVWGKPEIRDSVESIEDLLIDTQLGTQVRLAEVASVDILQAPASIRRQGVSRFIDVAVDVNGRNLGAVAGRVDEAIDGVAFPIEFHAELLGDYAKRLGAQRNLLSLAAIALIVTFLLLQAAFRSWRLALVAFLGLAASLSGGVLVAVVFGVASTAALAGLLAVLGIAASGSLMLIDHYLARERAAGAPDDAARIELVLTGTRDRLLPILATTVAMLLVVVPFAIFGNGAGLEILRPMAFVVLGGLVTSTLVNLYVVPGLYLSAKAKPEDEYDFSAAGEWMSGGAPDATD
jgi:Cu/Ag efflux pump CusA